MFAVAYIVGAALTGGMIFRANRLSGQNYVYLSLATVAWPLWLVLYGLTDTY